MRIIALSLKDSIGLAPQTSGIAMIILRLMKANQMKSLHQIISEQVKITPCVICGDYNSYMNVASSSVCSEQCYFILNMMEQSLLQEAEFYINCALQQEIGGY